MTFGGEDSVPGRLASPLDLRVVFDSAPALIHTARPDGHLDFFNRAWLEYLGLKLENMEGWKWTAVIHPDDLDGILKTWRASLVSGEPFLHETRVLRADGKYRWMLHQKLALRDQEGAILKWYGSSIDIEDRKQAEDSLKKALTEQEELTRQLRRRQAYLAEAQRLSHTGSFGWEVSSGKIAWSDETFRIFGFDRETEPTVNLVLERIHPDDRAMVRELIDRASDGKDFDIEYRLLFPDGAVKHVHVVAHAMKDELGSLEFVGAVMDVTAARQARAAVHARAEVSAALSKAVPIRGVLRECAEVLVRRLDALFARIWTVNPQETMLELQASAGMYTRLDGTYSRIPVGHLKVGWIASEKKAHLTNDVLTDPRVANKEWARSCGILSFAGYPLLVEKRAIGVMGIFSRYPLSNDTLDTLASVADAIAQGIDRKRAEAELEVAFKQIQVLKDQLYKENIALREEIDQTSMFEEIVGTAPPLKEVLARVSKVAPTDSTVLITGETGTGKELIARAIHKRSARASRVFVSVNCAGIPPALVASELFGHEKGAFTGALQRRIGRFELAEGGTIFLDEIGELPTETQIALLRVLQEREFERVGGGRPIRADIRLITATNRDLKAAIASGSFRSDLFYRLNVFPIEMPCLRARKEDIPLLAEYFIHRYAGKTGKKICTISRESLEMLQSYPWPGNIRELQNVIERSVIICETETLTVDESWFTGQTLEGSSSPQPLPKRISADEKTTIEAALAEARGRVSGPSGAAVKLGMPASTLESKIRALKINKHLFKTIGQIKRELR